MKKVILMLCLCMAIILPYHTSAQAIYNDTDMPLDLVINDTYVKTSLPLIENQGTVYIAARSLCELFGVTEMYWDDASATLTFYYAGKAISVQEYECAYTVGDTACTLARPAVTVDGRMYVPIRFAESVFGATIGWDAHHYNVTLTIPEYTVPYQYTNLYYQSDSIFWLARIVYAESRGESDAGKLGVANVILNRVHSPQFPNTIFEVIFDRKFGVQYTPTINGAIYNTPNHASVIAAKRALHGQNNVGASLYFFNPRIATSNWISQNRTYYTTIGNHAFYL